MRDLLIFAMQNLLPKLWLKTYDLQVIWQSSESVSIGCESVANRPKRVEGCAVCSGYGCCIRSSRFSNLSCRCVNAGRAGDRSETGDIDSVSVRSGRHQIHNSRMIETAGAANDDPGKEGWESRLQSAIENALNKPELLAQQNAWQPLSAPKCRT